MSSMSKFGPVLLCLFVPVVGCGDSAEDSGGGGGDTTTTGGTTTGVPTTSSTTSTTSTTSTAGDGGSGGGVNPPVCGDGAVEGTEGCDDGNTMADDGCDAACGVEDGWTCDGDPSVCMPVCGDGSLLGDEACDDGNEDADDGCDATCAIEPGWVCDGEPSACTEVCGDGIITISEECDDAGATAGDGCDDMCAVEAGYTCDGEPSVCSVECGDGLILAGEECDDGNSAAGDGCDAACAIEPGYVCNGEPSICNTIVGDTCAAPAVLNTGMNTVLWTATGQEYITAVPACSASTSYDPVGPDVVMQYTPTVSGGLDFSIVKPASQRWHLLVNDDACGTIGPELLCVSEFTAPAMAGEFPVTAGQTYYFYIVDSDSGTMPLSNPLQVTINVTQEICGDGTIYGSETCDDGDTAAGDGCSSSCGIEPGYVCQGEPSVCFVPPCAPGMNGVVGNTVTTFATNLPTTLTEGYIAVDDSPTGWIYVGGTTALHRVAKGAPGTSQNVTTLAGLTSSNLGYTMLIDGLDIYTLESKTSATTGHVWRISTDGGASWALTDYASLPAAPTDTLNSAVAYGGQLYSITAEATAGTATQLYKLSLGGPAPVPASVVSTFTGEQNCSGLAMDENFLYTACGTGERLVRVDRLNGSVTLLSTAFNLDLNANAVFAHDLDADGAADVLYFKGVEKRIGYVCDPGGANPYVAELATYGSTTSTSTLGMAFDPTTNTLYAFDDGTEEIVIIQ